MAPLHVTLSINETPIANIKISRLEKLKAKNRIYPYRVEADDITATFAHCYADGAEECARRALEALRIERERREKGSSR